MVEVVAYNCANRTWETFGLFETTEEAKQQIGLAKATSGLPGYVDYTNIVFKIHDKSKCIPAPTYIDYESRRERLKKVTES